MYEVILSVPGTGEQLAALLTGELGNLDRFKTNKKLNAFVGIDVAHYQSGNNEKKILSIDGETDIVEKYFMKLSFSFFSINIAIKITFVIIIINRKTTL